MREILTDRKFIISKITVIFKVLFIVSLLIFFLPLLILPFYNHASADDYVYGTQFYNTGFLQYQSIIYNTWSGRFSATFLMSLFLFHHFLYDHYYLHTLSLLLLNFFTIFLLIRVVCKYILKKQFTFIQLIAFSFIDLVLITLCVPELMSLLFWFSSAIIYFTGIILISLELWMFLILYYSTSKLNKSFCFAFLPLFNLYNKWL